MKKNHDFVYKYIMSFETLVSLHRILEHCIAVLGKQVPPFTGYTSRLGEVFSVRSRLLLAGLRGRPLKFVKHVAGATGVSPSPAGPPGSCPLYLLHLSNLSFIIGMPNRCCILELRANQCFVCNFLNVPKCKGQIAPKKTQCLSCLS